jgi:sulfur-oxidizing protein SoxY
MNRKKSLINAASMPGANRRGFLKRLMGVLAWTAGWVSAQPASRQRPGKAPASRIAAGDFQQALAAALGGRPWLPSDAVRVDIPLLAENGAIVPITVESSLPATRRILVFARNNPDPLLAEFHFEPGVDPSLSLRVKLNETGPVLAIAESGEQFFGVEILVKVMVSGCG